MMPLYERLFFEVMLNALSMLCAGLRKLLDEDKRMRHINESRTDIDIVPSVPYHG